MLSNLDKKIVYSLLISTAILAVSPLQAMDDQRDQNPPKSIASKKDPNNNNHSDLDEHPINPVIGVSINPSWETFSLENVVKKAHLQMIEIAENWVEVAGQALKFVRTHENEVDFGGFEVDIYSAILSHLLPEHTASKGLSMPLTSEIDDLFKIPASQEEKKLTLQETEIKEELVYTNEERAKKAIHRALSKHIKQLEDEQLFSVCEMLGLFQDQESAPRAINKEEVDTKENNETSLGASQRSHFRKHFRDVLGKTHFRFALYKEKLINLQNFLKLVGGFALRPHGAVDTVMLEEAVKFPNLIKLELSVKHIDSLAPLEGSASIRELDLTFTKNLNMGPLSKMPNLRSINLVGADNILNLEALLESDSLEQIWLPSKVDTSILEKKFEFVESLGWHKILTRKTADPTTNRND